MASVASANAPWRRIGVGAGVALLAFATGVGGVVALTHHRGGARIDTHRVVAPVHLPAVTDASAAGVVGIDPNTPPLGSVRAKTAPTEPGASSALDAVTTYLAAEASGDYASSYRLLSGTDRARWASPAEWVLHHGEAPAVTGFRAERVAVHDDSAEVFGETDLRPQLDRLVGAVAAHAAGVWVARRDANGWHVDVAASRLTPQYPSDTGVDPAAREWAMQACADDERSGTLLGSPSLARPLCGMAITVGQPSLVDPSDPDQMPVITGFGTDVSRWARLVEVSGPAHLRLVLGPLGDAWRVVAVLAP